MTIIKTPFSQNKFLSPDEPGICNSLVMEWLAQDGRQLTYMRRHVKRARAVHERGLRAEQIREFGFEIGEQSDIYPGASLQEINTIVDKLKRSPNKKFIIGFCGEKAHAIGMIKTATGAKGFDPNNGYYEIDKLDESFDWVKKKILGARLKHGYREFLVFELTQ